MFLRIFNPTLKEQKIYLDGREIIMPVKDFVYVEFATGIKLQSLFPMMEYLELMEIPVKEVKEDVKVKEEKPKKEKKVGAKKKGKRYEK